jgi:hypothetical protein
MSSHKPCRSGDKCGFPCHWTSPILSFPLPNGRFPYIKIGWARQHFETGLVGHPMKRRRVQDPTYRKREEQRPR